MKRMKVSLAFTAAAATLIAAACSLFTPKLEKPHLSVVAITVGKSDFFAQHLDVRLRVENPNDRALPVQGLSYTLDVAGQEAARGASSASFVVPPMGEAEFDMDVTANLAGTLLRLLLARSDASHSDRVEYHLTGKVTLSRGLLRSIPFDEHGTFGLK
jgi:LEA14-like dessication related protein